MAKKKFDCEIKRFVTSRGKNQYLLISRGEGALIDVSEPSGEIDKFIYELGVNMKYLLVTHAHKPHIQALQDLKEKYGGIFCLHEYEFELYQEMNSNLAPDREINDHDLLPLGDIDIEVLLTAGHTKGSVCYYVRKADALFSGSTFLKGGYGKIWGPKSMSLMLFSLKRLSYNLPGRTRIYTGSGDLTEMKNEGWVQCLRSV
jgi:glyoxylase-like metal-dependent hydrolase (beta-lactamase superfamily II)